MIIVVKEIDPNPEALNFKRLYLCITREPAELLNNEYIEDFMSYDNGVACDINDPFLLSYIYAN